MTNLNEFLEQVIFSLWEHDFLVGDLLKSIISLGLTFFVYRLTLNTILPLYFRREKIKTENPKRIKRIIRVLFYIIALALLIWSLGLDFTIYEINNFSIRITTVLEALIILQVSRLLDWLISKFLLLNYYRTREQNEKDSDGEFTRQEPEGFRSRVIQYSVYLLAVILIIQSLDIDYIILSGSRYQIRLSNIIGVALIFLIAQLVYWILTQLVLYNYYKKNEVNVGSSYAINQLLMYVIYVVAIFIALENLGIQMTVIWGGAAALLVGVGLGLQQTFNDLFSGIILLFERTVEVGDMIEVTTGDVGTVKKIGIRTSLVETRFNVSVIVPNSKLITEKVINWSHNDDKIRFMLNVGVAYGSDTALVKKLLIEIARNNVYVLEHPSPFIRFTNFGNSSLDFELHFYSRNFIVIEDIKSDLRFAIDQAFRESGISIPFPQQDIWFRNGVPPATKKSKDD